jgi:hypothetical protein
VEQGSILVVGEPGAGKSGGLHDLIEALGKEDRDYVFLAADRLAARSLGQLREEIGLDHDLPEVLDNWPGIQPGFLIIDALDAARGDAAQRMIQDLIRQIIVKGGRWCVVASIRKFDLRYCVEIKELFAGAPSKEFQDPEFTAIKHLNVQCLSEDELSQVASQSATLHALVSNAPEELHDLLRVPFNLRLMGDLLGAGVALNELTPISTQLELLDRYWLHRVVRADGYGLARERVLHEACEKMVEERALRVDSLSIGRPETSALLADLCSTQVLIEWQPSPDAPPNRYILAFSHNVLFDYAVARLLLRGRPENVLDRLASDPNLVVVIRPSLVLHFRHMWTVDKQHQQFSDLVLRVIQAPKIPEIGKLVGPSVAAELTRQLSDLEPLCEVLEDPRPESRGAAEQAVRHLFGALLAGARGGEPLLGPGAGPWSEILNRVSQNLGPALAYTVRSLLTTICDRPEEFTAEQRAVAGKAARRMLEFAWPQTPRDSWLVAHALQCVCRTFESDPAASALLIRGCLEPSHLVAFGFEEMPWLAREVGRLITLDSALVEEIYRVAFGHQESSDEKTRMGYSRILPMISTRRQDYGMAVYELAEIFPRFLESAPRNATRALIAAIEAYVLLRHTSPSDEREEETFELDDHQATIRSDFSSVWDEGDTYRHDEPLKMLDAFQRYLERLAGTQGDSEELHELVQILILESRFAVLWRRLLRGGARFPATLGREILPLAWAKPILTAYDTIEPAGEFLRAIFPTIEREMRRRIELTLLSIPETAPPDRREAGERVRNRLLGCLVEHDIVTEEARLLLEALRSKNAIPPNKPPFRLETTWGGPYGEEEYLRDEGVPVEAEANRTIRELERPVKEFAEKHLNSTPSSQEIIDVLPALQALHHGLAPALADGVHPKQSAHAWGNLAAACARVARAEALSSDDDTGVFVRRILLQASNHDVPIHDPERDAQFDEHPSWGGPAARIEAAEGLVVLARQSAGTEHEVPEAVERLSKDPVPAVRFQIATHLNTLYRTAPELMWQIIERMARDEPSRGVLQGLLSGPFNRLAAVEWERIATYTAAIYDRVREGHGAKQVREFCLGHFAGLYIWRDHGPSRQVVLDIATNPAANPDDALHLLAHLRAPVTHGPAEPPDAVAEAVRRRAVDLLDRILRSARDGLRQFEKLHAGVPVNEWPQHDQETVKSLLRLIDGVGTESYFASGAYDGKHQGQPGEVRGLKPESERFYREAGPILDELADTGIPSVTHHLLETLELFIPLDPRGVFLRIGHVVRAGKHGGYQYESLAADLIVRLVERYLAEYRTLLREDEECRRILVEVLDVFVDAGWPSARRLTYRLEEIFR